VRICEHLFARQQVSHGIVWEDAIYGDVDVPGVSMNPSSPSRITR
jgi:hypothetical protein